MENKSNKNPGLFQSVADRFSRLFRREKPSSASAAPASVSSQPAPEPVQAPEAKTQTALTAAPKPQTVAVGLTNGVVQSPAVKTPEVETPAAPKPVVAPAVADREVQSQPETAAPRSAPAEESHTHVAPAVKRKSVTKRLHIADLTPEEAQELLENFVAEHISDEMLSVETMAAQLKVSRTGLYQLVHDHFAMTPGNYIINRRLTHACKLLAEGRKVREVSMKCGFSDPKYFSKVFKKAYGVLPSGYVG